MLKKIGEKNIFFMEKFYFEKSFFLDFSRKSPRPIYGGVSAPPSPNADNVAILGITTRKNIIPPVTERLKNDFWI